MITSRNSTQAYLEQFKPAQFSPQITSGHQDLVNKIQLEISFWNAEQKVMFWSTFRNNCMSGGFGNGKTWISCARHFMMLSTFPGYISVFGRQEYKQLKSTTMKTFFKLCPREFILRHDVQEGITIFTNGSVALWLHLDSFDEQSLRGLEFNSGTLDQVEEIDEAIYLVFDGRIGRWDGARVPDGLLLSDTPSEAWKDINYSFNDILYNPKLNKVKEGLIAKSTWPRHPKSGRFRVRNFLDVLCNPADEFHWVYRRYHPESLERKKNHFYIERPTDDSMNDPETIENMKDRDPEWVAKYYEGKWGKSAAQIHKIHKMSIIDSADYDEGLFKEFLRRLLERGALYRSLDHGDTAPTCCLWFANLNLVHICYREYYVPDQTISFHREAITELSKNPFTKFLEEYQSDVADPSIFYKLQRFGNGKNNPKTSIADEYASDEIPGPMIFWSAGDNNEFATRNRINELLKLSPKYAHPITKECPAPGLYFIKRTESYVDGCNQAILQLQKQRREIIGSDNGRTIYSDNRAEGVADHAYDPIRYYVAEHSLERPQTPKEPPARSFANFEKIRTRNLNLLLPNF